MRSVLACALLGLALAACAAAPARRARRPAQRQRAIEAPHWIGFADPPELRWEQDVVFHRELPLLALRSDGAVHLFDLTAGLVRAEQPRVGACAFRHPQRSTFRPREPLPDFDRFVPFADCTPSGWTAAVWDLDRDVALRPREAHPEGLADLALTRDGSIALLFEGEGRASAVELGTGRRLYEIAVPRGELRAIAHGEGDRAYLWIAGDGTPPLEVASLLALDTRSGRELGRVERADWSPSFVVDRERGVVAIGWGGALALHDAGDLRLLREIPIAGNFQVLALGEGEVFSGAERVVRRFDVRSGEEREPVQPAPTRIRSLAWAGGHLYAELFGERVVRLEEDGSFSDVGAARAIVVSPDRARIALRTEARVVVLDASTGERVSSFELLGQIPEVSGLAVRPDGGAIALLSRWWSVRALQIDARGVRAVSRWVPESDPLYAAPAPALSLSACAQDRGLCVVDHERERIRARLQGTSGEAVFRDDHGDSHELDLSLDGSRALVLRQREWRLFDARDGRLLSRRRLARRAIGAMLLSNELAVWWSEDDVAQVVRVGDGSVVFAAPHLQLAARGSRYAVFRAAEDELLVVDATSGARSQIEGLLRSVIGLDASGTILRVRAPGGVERDLSLPEGTVLRERVVDPDAWLHEAVPSSWCAEPCAFHLEDDVLTRARDGARFTLNVRAMPSGEVVALVTDEAGRFWAPPERLGMLAARVPGPIVGAHAARVDARHPQYAPDLLRTIFGSAQ